MRDNPNLKDRIDRVREKGHTRLTVLIIPHGYDSSFNFQISIFTIGFIILLLCSLISLSFYGIFKSSNTKKEINNLSEIYGAYFDDYVEASKYLDQAEEDYSVINENLLEVFSYFDGQDDELFKLIDRDELEARAFQEIRSEELTDSGLMEGRNFLSEVYEFRTLKHEMQSRIPLLDANFNYFDNRASVLEKLPIVNPLPFWNNTSSFGMRKSPTSGFWEFHDGIDMANATGTPIYAAAPGTVVRLIYSKTGYGHHIVISHEFGYYTLYAHCNRIFIRPGQYVEKGKLIAEVGATGNVTGPHLHYEVWVGEGNKADPEEYLNAGTL
ncbi:M23 family metallopeptidase [Leptospira sp. GIMC2001]|nr:M23 family metallopeptidase [Leptospira sp. GIMC2001]WCL51424.1 M23 family metallopeptidase [Leptospira sp. GIMC2001]